MREKSTTGVSAKYAEVATFHQDNALMGVLENGGVEAVILSSTYRDAKTVSGLGFEGVVPLIVDNMIDAATFTAVVETMWWIGWCLPDMVLILVENLDGLSPVEEYLFSTLYGKVEVRLIMGNRGGMSLDDFEVCDPDAFRSLISGALERKPAGV